MIKQDKRSPGGVEGVKAVNSMSSQFWGGHILGGRRSEGETLFESWKSGRPAFLRGVGSVMNLWPRLAPEAGSPEIEANARQRMEAVHDRIHPRVR